ncbi:MAG: hypothetical protein U0R50_13960 [Gaiellales bacterium]
MRFVLNTRSDTAGAQASIFALAERMRAFDVDATVNDWDRYDRYDVAIFMGYDHELERAKATNPEILVGLADPKQSKQEWIDAARAADFLLVSSVEQREAFLRLNRNCFVLLMFPLVQPETKVHGERDEVVLAYHGNRAHLEAMAHTATPALEELGRRRRVRLVCVTNHARYGLPERGLPDPKLVDVTHVQFEPGPPGGVAESFRAALGASDIGLAPNLLPLVGRREALRATASSNPWLAYEPFDWLLRFKASSNPGRLYPFARLGIPVVAELTPSLAQFVDDGVSGALVATPEGWFEALERLSSSAALRTSMAAALRTRLDAAVTRQATDLLAFVGALDEPAPLTFAGSPSVESELAELDRYASPARPGFIDRLRSKLG